MTQYTQNSIVQDVLDKIKQKRISIHSKMFFRLRFLTFFLILIAICLISVLLCSFILFNIKMSGQSDFIGFGSQGVYLFFAVFPWILFTLDILLIALLGRLMRQFSFGYKIPGMYIVAVIFTLIVIIGYVLEAKTTFHKDMLSRADKKQLPLFKDAYLRVRRAPPIGYEIYRGMVILREGGVIYVDLDDEEGVGTSTTVMVNIANDPRGSQIEIGDSVFIAGKIVDGEIISAKLKAAPRLPRPF